MFTKKGLFIILLLIAILAFIKITYFKKEEDTASKSKSGPTTKNAMPLKVKGYVVKTEKIEDNFFVSGTALANETAEIRSEVSGKLINIYFKEGQNVTKNMLLAKVNDAELQAQLRKADFQYKLAQQTESRVAKLLEIKGVSREEYDIASNQVNSLLADMDILKAQIEKTNIRAPFTGKIGLRNLAVGSYISPANILSNLVQTNPIKIEFEIPEKYLNLVKPGKIIHLKLDDNDIEITAKVYSTDAAINLDTRTMKVRALTDNGKNTIAAGQFLSVNVPLHTVENAMMIPSQALASTAKGKQVLMVIEGQAMTKDVITGIRTGDKIQILEGLKTNDTVIISGLMQLKPKDNVQIILEKTEAK
jgi:membrane fusion protein, multidrug efflux system